MDALLKFDPDEPRDEAGKWTSGGGGGSEDSQGFVSPNVGNLNFQQAMAGLSSPRQKVLTQASADIDQAIGRAPASASNVIGAWADGAENSIALRMPGWSTQEARAALAMKGWIGDQKSALLFTPAQEGNSFMASFSAKGELAQIHQKLLDAGLEFHTLEPISGGATVHIYGDGQDTVDKIGKAAESYGSKSQFTFGNGEFIGTKLETGSDREQRDDARRGYEAVIATAATAPEFRGRDLAKTWNDLRSRWGGILSQTKAIRAGHDVSDEPRDPGGKWTSGGGDGGDKGEHPGAGYSKNAYVDSNGVIHTSNVYDAQRALFEDRKVELKQVKQVSTLIKRLGETAAEMAEHGETAPTFNLCNVSVKGTNLFCADQIGIPRVEMPVIRAGATKDFIKYLKKQGYDIEKGTEESRNLRATQNEISGSKVAAAMEKIKDRGFYKRLVVSRDDYILDGHHTWAGQLALDAKDNDLENDGRTVKIARVDISITKLIAEAEKWTGGKGKKPASEAPKNYRLMTLKQAQRELDPATYWKFANLAYRFFAANGHLARGFDDIMITVPKKFDPDEPRDEAGKWTEGGGGEAGGAAGGSTGSAAKAKAKVEKISDFDKKGIRLDHNTTINPEKAEKFLARWNERVQQAPEDFKKDFIGVPGTMTIEYDDYSDRLGVAGQVREGNDDGRTIGSYQRVIDLENNSAYSAYFVLKKGERGEGIGKKLLASNIAMYQKMGIDTVRVSANIDVGGYAWAKYGYVPTREAWRNLSSDIRDKLNEQGGRASRVASGSGYTPESWEEISDHDQSQIETAWMRATESEFLDSEIQNWRDSGQALEDAKRDLSTNPPRDEKWAQAALERWRSGLRDEGASIPYTNAQLLAATDIEEYSSPYGEGRSDPDISINEERLAGFLPEQPLLPGIPEAPPLTEKTTDEITSALTEAFNDEAESNAQDAEPPSYIADSVSENQSDYWSSMSARERFSWADRNGELPEYPIENDEEEPPPAPVAASDPQRDALMKLAQSSDPKALWAIADSSQGKSLLLGTSWAGVLNLKDKQTMDRFNSYVGKK